MANSYKQLQTSANSVIFNQIQSDSNNTVQLTGRVMHVDDGASLNSANIFHNSIKEIIVDQIDSFI